MNSENEEIVFIYKLYTRYIKSDIGVYKSK